MPRTKQRRWKNQLPMSCSLVRAGSGLQVGTAILTGLCFFSDKSSEGLLFPLVFILTAAVGLSASKVALENVKKLSTHYHHTFPRPPWLAPLALQQKGSSVMLVGAFVLGFKQAFQNLKFSLFSDFQASTALVFNVTVLATAIVLSGYGAYQLYKGIKAMPQQVPSFS